MHRPRSGSTPPIFYFVGREALKLAEDNNVMLRNRKDLVGTSAERTALASLRLIRGKGIRMLPYTTSVQPLEHNRVIELRTGIEPPQRLHALRLYS